MQVDYLLQEEVVFEHLDLQEVVDLVQEDFDLQAVDSEFLDLQVDYLLDLRMLKK